MAVESRFVVIRNGVEVQTFMDKKAADEYDKMLDMADNLSAMLTASAVALSEDITEELSVFLAQNREAVLIALQAKKPKVEKKASKKLNFGEKRELEEVEKFLEKLELEKADLVKKLNSNEHDFEKLAVYGYIQNLH